MDERRDDPDQSLPRPLVVALAVVSLEALTLVTLAGLELLSLSSGRLTMGFTTALFFVVCGAALLLCAWGASRLRPWSRSPIVLAQLIQLGVAWSFRGGETTLVAIALASAAVVVLVGMLHPATTQALQDDPVRAERT